LPPPPDDLVDEPLLLAPDDRLPELLLPTADRLPPDPTELPPKLRDPYGLPVLFLGPVFLLKAGLRFVLVDLSLIVLLSWREIPYTLSIPLDITEFRLVDLGKNEADNASNPPPVFFLTFFGGALLGGAFLAGALLGEALFVTLLPLVELLAFGFDRLLPLEFDLRTTVPESDFFVRVCVLVPLLLLLSRVFCFFVTLFVLPDCVTERPLVPFRDVLSATLFPNKPLLSRRPADLLIVLPDSVVVVVFLLLKPRFF